MRNSFKVVLFFSGVLCAGHCTMAQRIDSIHVYRQKVEGPITTAAANTLVWRSHQENAPRTTVKGDELHTVNEMLGTYKPGRHAHGELKDLKHLAMVFAGGRPIAFGVTGDLDRVINFTARREYQISSLAEHIRVRALLAKFLMER